MNHKNTTFQWLARRYVARRLQRQFEDVRCFGLPHLRSVLKSQPVILACNHVAWWDPLILVQLDDKLGSDGYCLMDKENLSRLPFFSWLGAVPLDRSSPKAAYRDLHHSAELLNAPGRMLIVFPQGEQRPAHLPLSFRPGVSALSERTRLPVHPVALRYDFRESERQVVHLSVGRALKRETAEPRQHFAQRLEAVVMHEMERIDAALLSGDGYGFTSLLGRSEPTPMALPRATAVLGRLAARSIHESEEGVFRR